MNQNQWHYEMPDFAKEAFRRRDAKAKAKIRRAMVVMVAKYILILIAAVMGIGVLMANFISSPSIPEVEPVVIDLTSNEWSIQWKTIINPDQENQMTYYKIRLNSTGEEYSYCVEKGTIKRIND